MRGEQSDAKAALIQNLGSPPHARGAAKKVQSYKGFFVFFYQISFNF